MCRRGSICRESIRTATSRMRSCGGRPGTTGSCGSTSCSRARRSSGRSFGAPELRFAARHELAHHRRHHLWKGAAWFALFALPCAFVLAWAGERRGGFGRPEAVPAVLLAAFCIQLVSLPVGGAIARRYEAEADWTALRATPDPAAARRLFVDFAH